MRCGIACYLMIAVAAAFAADTFDAKTNADNGYYHEKYTRNYSKAEAFYNAALKDPKADEETKARAKLGLAACALAQGKTNDAMRLTMDAFKGRPDKLKAFLTNRGSLATGQNQKAPPKMESPKVRAIRKTLEQTVISKISFVDTRITTVFEFLKTQTRNLKGGGTPVNFMIIGPAQIPKDDIWLDDPGDDGFELEGEDDDPFGEEDEDDGDQPKPPPEPEILEPTLTMDFDNVPLGKAIGYICEQINYNYAITDEGVIITTPGVTLEDLELRFFKVDPANADRKVEGEDTPDVHGTYLDLFKKAGVTFPVTRKGHRATLSYDRGTNQLVVRNTPANIRLMETIMKRLYPHPSQSRVKAVLWELDVPEKVLSGIAPQKIPVFIDELPKNKRNRLSVSTLSGLDGVVGEIKECERTQMAGQSLQVYRHFSASTKPVDNDDVISVDLMWKLKAWSPEKAPVDDGDRPKAPPIWSFAVDKKLLVGNGKRVALAVMPAADDKKRGALFLVVEAAVIDETGAVAPHPAENVKAVEPDGTAK